MTRTAARIACLCTLLLLAARPALAEDAAIASGDPVPMSDADLDDQRGGMSTPSGVQFYFGAVVNTYIDGQLALQTQLTWTDQGVVQTTQGNLASDLVSQAAAGGIHLSPNAAGAYVPGINGGTVVLNSIDPGQIANAVLNTADNRTITQNTNITLTIPNLAQYQADTQAVQTAMKIQDAINRAVGITTH